MEKWIEIGIKNGLAVLAVIALAAFFYKKIWPLIEKRLDNADAQQKEYLRLMKEQGESFTKELKEQREADDRRFEETGRRFTETLRTQNVFATEAHREILDRIEGIAKVKRPSKQQQKQSLKRRR